ncbi:MAG: hypothetical protein COV76_02905 [Candidatus Omnitrophica bacterium CG11_big_fil_rev_8_21_14_0_20_64_10]|nr:MAG: hypothetical protein COV76_02905 [Candidatus Omnitrophica bacterium CG11_big_fil_rev_8_21_14_0_20_64_10]
MKPGSLRRLKIASVLLKGLAVLSVLLMAVGVVGVIVSGNPNEIPLRELLIMTGLNVCVPFLISALLFYALGGIITLLLTLERNSRSAA